MLKRTCCPGWTKAHSRIMRNVPHIAAVDQHKALAIAAKVKAHHQARHRLIRARGRS
jgi:hypothetical protein